MSCSFFVLASLKKVLRHPLKHQYLCTMGIIRVNNIRLYTNHGCLEEEGKIGSEYRVDLEIKADLQKSAQSDELKDTVDYVHLNHIVKEEMAIRSKLLEHVAKRIIDRIFNELPMVTEAEVSVAKINPPIGGDVEQVVIVLQETRKN
ncbi:7,8-dihydroneopterin aldolase [Tenacibaculum litopenaei]